MFVHVEPEHVESFETFHLVVFIGFDDVVVIVGLVRFGISDSVEVEIHFIRKRIPAMVAYAHLGVGPVTGIVHEFVVVHYEFVLLSFDFELLVDDGVHDGW